MRLLILLFIPFFSLAQFRPPTQFSVSIKDALNGSEKAHEAKLLGSNWIRTDGITMSTWSSGDNAYKRAQDSGLKVMVNFSWGVSGSFFQTDTATYKTKFLEIVNNCPQLPDAVTFEDEPGNGSFHNGSLLTYLNILKAMVPLCRSLGIKVITDGAVSDVGVEALIYKYYSDNHMTSDSASFGRCLKNANKPSIIAGSFSEMLQVDTLLTGYRTIALTHVNMHIKLSRVDADTLLNTVFPSRLFKIFDWYIYKRTGKHPITNELAARNNASGAFMTDLIKSAREAKFYLVSFISNNNGDDAESPLIISNVLQPAGTTLKTYLDQYYRRAIP
jgi:hypothetical protein